MFSVYILLEQGSVNYGLWPQSGPPSVSAKFYGGTASLSTYCLWLHFHHKGRLQLLLQGPHNPRSLEYLLSGLLQRKFADTWLQSRLSVEGFTLVQWILFQRIFIAK